MTTVLPSAKLTTHLRLPPMRRRTAETVGEFVHRRLRHAIMTGRFPPGVAVTIRGLAALLGTSAMPVREAMRRLAAEQALDLMDNGRARVPAMTGARFAALIDARVLLERAAAQAALPHVEAARLAELHRLDQAVNEAFARGDIERTIETNLAFHRRLYTLVPEDALTPLIESIWLQIGPFMRAALQEAAVYIAWTDMRRHWQRWPRVMRQRSAARSRRTYATASAI